MTTTTPTTPPGGSRTLGKAIKDWRLEREWTQTEMATRSGISQHQISLIERGGSAPGPEIIARLADTFGLTPNALFEIAQWWQPRTGASTHVQVEHIDERWHKLVRGLAALPDEDQERLRELLEPVMEAARLQARRRGTGTP